MGFELVTLTTVISTTGRARPIPHRQTITDRRGCGLASPDLRPAAHISADQLPGRWHLPQNWHVFTCVRPRHWTQTSQGFPAAAEEVGELLGPSISSFLSPRDPSCCPVPGPSLVSWERTSRSSSTTVLPISSLYLTLSFSLAAQGPLQVPQLCVMICLVLIFVTGLWTPWRWDFIPVFPALSPTPVPGAGSGRNPLNACWMTDKLRQLILFRHLPSFSSSMF